jgi:hypothetical protein
MFHCSGKRLEAAGQPWFREFSKVSLHPDIHRGLGHLAEGALFFLAACAP